MAAAAVSALSELHGVAVPLGAVPLRPLCLCLCLGLCGARVSLGCETRCDGVCVLCILNDQ